jgi:5-methylcytosine-specific restriction endonuclease McrA
MPIRPENKSRYPANWKEIRENILERANHKCEGVSCGLKNHSFVLRCNKSDAFISEDANPEYVANFKLMFADHRRVKVVLTIAHLDHTPENCDPANLKAWCQKCHNEYDAPMRAAGRRERGRKVPRHIVEKYRRKNAT